jgi:hypothetical protein
LNLLSFPRLTFSRLGRFSRILHEVNNFLEKILRRATWIILVVKVRFGRNGELRQDRNLYPLFPQGDMESAAPVPAAGQLTANRARRTPEAGLMKP